MFSYPCPLKVYLSGLLSSLSFIFFLNLSLAQSEDEVMIAIKEALKEIYGVDVEVIREGNLKRFNSCFNSQRRQFRAGCILSQFHTNKEKISLIVIDEDLYEEGLNFVFGEANPERRLAIISLTRLYGSLPRDKELLIERAKKEACHEIGHLLNLGHCPGIYCVMHFSNSLYDTDVKSYKLCSVCKKKLEEM